MSTLRHTLNRKNVNSNQWPVSLACEVLQVSASGYFEHWRRKDASKPSRAGGSARISNEALLGHIRAIHVSHPG